MHHEKVNAMQVLITGGAGFIGSHLAETLLQRGDSVAILDNLSTGAYRNIAHLTANPRFSFAIESLSNDLVLDRLASQADAIVHLAAAVGVQLVVERPTETIETNVIGTHAVLSTARRYRCRTLIASTSEVYGKSAEIPFKEGNDLLLGPSSHSRWGYAASKLLDEFLGLAAYRAFSTQSARARQDATAWWFLDLCSKRCVGSRSPFLGMATRAAVFVTLPM
jgi:UDP-glucose 4-epimerase